MPASPSTSARSPTAARPVACLRCRGNRVFCTKEQPKCKLCKRYNQECIYEDNRRIRSSYVRSLEKRLAQVEAEKEQEDDEFEDLSTQSINDGLSNLIISPTGTLRHLGSTSAHILERRIRNMLGTTDPFQIDQETSQYNARALKLTRSISNEHSLPPYDVAQEFFEKQHNMIGTIFAFVDEHEFHIRFGEASIGPPDINDHDSCLSYCQVLLTMAFGQLYALNRFVSNDGPPGFQYFAQALQYLPEIHAEPSILFCRVLGLVGYFMQTLGRRDAAFMYLGLAQRMAISLALHEEIAFPIDNIEREQRRRVFWSIYSLDRILCIKYGNPITMRDEDISAKLPSRLPHEPEYCSAIVLRNYTVLSQILSQIMDRIYRKAGATQLMTAIKQIMTRLLEWEKDLPPQLRIHSMQVITSREALSTYLHYYQCISMTARPLLFWVVEKRLKDKNTSDWKEGFQADVTFPVEKCVSAAKHTISIMHAAAENHLVANFGYMDGEHAFCSALVLVMVCIAFPYNEEHLSSMESALELLRSLRAKGNYHIEAKHEMLLQLLAKAERTNPALAAHRGGPVNMMPTAGPDPQVLEQQAINELFPTDPEMISADIYAAAYADPYMNVEVGLDHLNAMQFMMAEQFDEEVDQPEHQWLPEDSERAGGCDSDSQQD